MFLDLCFKLPLWGNLETVFLQHWEPGSPHALQSHPFKDPVSFCCPFCLKGLSTYLPVEHTLGSWAHPTSKLHPPMSSYFRVYLGKTGPSQHGQNIDYVRKWHTHLFILSNLQTVEMTLSPVSFIGVGSYPRQSAELAALSSGLFQSGAIFNNLPFQKNSSRFTLI